MTNYAQYESREAFERLRTNSAIAPFIERVRALIKGAEPHLYEVSGSVSAP